MKSAKPRDHLRIEASIEYGACAGFCGGIFGALSASRVAEERDWQT